MKCYIFENGTKELGWEDEYEKFLQFLVTHEDILKSFWGPYEDPDT